MSEIKKFFAYCRVSTKKQKKEGTIKNQRRIIKENALWNRDVKIVEWFEDNGISAFKDRPKFDEMFSRLNECDGIIIAKLSRIGRSVQQLEEIVNLLKNKGKIFIVVKDNVNTSTPQGKLFFHLLASFMEYEASLIKERTTEGRERARENGVKFGRKRLDTKDKEIKRLYVQKEIGIVSIAKIIGISKSTVRRRLLEMDVKMRPMKGVEQKA